MHEKGTGHPTVLLRHERPDGSVHVDWLIGRDPAGQEPLISFRVADRVDNMSPDATRRAERLADHRPRYLAYEGPIDRERGSVLRLARGDATVIGDPDSAAFSLRVRWSDSSQYLTLERLGGVWWRIAARPVAACVQ